MTEQVNTKQSEFLLIDDKKAPKTCKNLYRYLLDKGYYDNIETRLNRKV